MVATIVLNNTNVSNLNNGNNQLVYPFPNSIAFPNHEIAIQSISMYYAWSNINATTLQNNTYYLHWEADDQVSPAYPVGGNYTITMPDGLYEIVTINQFLQFFCIQNGLFMISPSGAYVYFAEWTVNTSKYAIQLNLYPVPSLAYFTSTLSPAGWTLPVANAVTGVGEFAGFPTPVSGNGLIPFVFFKNTTNNYFTNFYKIVGFPSDYSTATDPTAIASLGADNYSVISTTAPQVQPNPTLYIALSNIENNMATPSSIIGVVSPQVNYGELISITPPQFAWNKMLGGTYNNLRLTFLGSDRQPIQLLDPTMTITLVIRDKKDVSLTDAIASASGGK